MDQVVRDVLDAVERRDWALLRGILHPYVHWTDGDGTVHGRTKVLLRLDAEPTTAAPESYETRDGQVYRWSTARR